MRTGFVICGWVILAVLTAAGIVLLSGLRSWPYELLHHFVLHYFMLSCCLAVSFLLARERISALWSTTLLVLFAGFLWSAYGAPVTNLYRAAISPDTSQNQRLALTVITHNVRDRNKRHRELRTWLRSNPADIVALQEVPSREAALYREEGVFSHQMEVYDPALNHPSFPDDKAFVILSKYPVALETKFKPFEQSRPIAIVRVSVPDAEDTWLVLVDAWDPKTMTTLVNRDRLLLGIAPEISELRGPVIVAGDFNATPFTPVFREFMRLANVALLQPPVSTFPAALGWLGIPIDHILVRDL